MIKTPSQSTALAHNDSVARYMNAFHREDSRLRMESALRLIALVDRVTGYIRRIPNAPGTTVRLAPVA